MKVTVIVPAFNEEKSLRGVLTALVESKYIDEVICVNDGSTDSTLKVAKKLNKVILINLRKNHGKGYAIAKGIQKSTGDIILLIDADFKLLTEYHILQLLNPLIRKKFDISLGYIPVYNKNRIIKKFNIALQSITGERAYFRKDLLPIVNQLKKKGYGLELYLNHFFKHKKTIILPLKGVKHSLKHEKQSINTAAKLYIIEGFDLLIELFSQKQTIPSYIKKYLSSFYLYQNPQIQKKIKIILKKIKSKLINSV